MVLINFEDIIQYTFEKSRLWLLVGLLYVIGPLAIVAGAQLAADQRRADCGEAMYRGTMLARDRFTYGQHKIPPDDPRVNETRLAGCIVKDEVGPGGKPVAAIFKYTRADALAGCLKYVGGYLLLMIILHLVACSVLKQRDIDARRQAANL